jgi:hypothetical protein
VYEQRLTLADLLALILDASPRVVVDACEAVPEREPWYDPAADAGRSATAIEGHVGTGDGMPAPMTEREAALLPWALWRLDRERFPRPGVTP